MTQQPQQPEFYPAAGAPVLVFGASGYVGSNLVPWLLTRGISVRAVSRNVNVLAARGWEGAELVQADALAPETLPAALDGCETAYYLVHSMAAGRRFGAIDLEAAANFAAAAEQAGVKRIVYLGGLVPDDAGGEHIESRRETGEVLRRGAVPVTEIRAGIIIGPGSAAFEVMRDLTLNLPMMVTPRWVRALSPPIALDNLLYYLEKVPALPEAAGRVFDAGGPESVSYQQMMGMLADVAGKRRPLVIPVPVLSPHLSSYWLGLVTAVPADVAKALIGGLKHDFFADSEPLRKLVPQALLGVRDAIQAAFNAEREHRTAARWTEGVFAMRGFRHDVAFYAKHASGTAVTSATPAALWDQIVHIGGPERYYYMNGLWWIRELMDWCVAGPGFTRGRRDSDELRLGDVVDYWTVIGLEPERHLTLHFGLRAPGSGILEFDIKPVADGQCELCITAHWHPRGVWGLLYWFSMLPAHLFLFRGWTRTIARRAEKALPPANKGIAQGT